MRRISLSPTAYRRITLAAAVLLGVIIVTGGAVRLSDSGLGCPVGISCPASQLQAHGPSSVHATIEHVNRLFTGLVSVTVIVAVLGSLVRTPRRRDLTWLSWGLVVGVFAQAVLGQLTVAFDLTPGFVMAHFLVSIVLLTDAIVLYARAGVPDESIGEPNRRATSGRVVALVRALLVLASLVLVTGTVVTGAGPHSGGGKGDDVTRLDIPITDAARLHGTIVMAFLGVVCITVLVAWRDGAPARVRSRLTVLLVVLVAQAAVGYTQYFTDIPPVLVGIHIAGAALVWTATLWTYLGCFERRPSDATATAARPVLATA
jgi:cytochrome c oxidase assembly protein subunit 15